MSLKQAWEFVILAPESPLAVGFETDSGFVVWDLRNGDEIGRFAAKGEIKPGRHEANICGSIYAAGTKFLYADSAGGLWLVDLPNGIPRQLARTNHGRIYWLALSSDEDKILAATDRGGIMAIDTSSGRVFSESHLANGILPVARLNGAASCLLGDSTGAVYIFNPLTESIFRFPPRFSAAIKSLSCSRDGSSIFVLDEQGKACAADVRNGRILWSLQVDQWMGNVAFDPLGYYLAFSPNGDAEVVRLIEVATARCATTLEGRVDDLVTAIAFSDDGAHLLVNSEMRCRVWRLFRQPIDEREGLRALSDQSQLLRLVPISSAADRHDIRGYSSRCTPPMGSFFLSRPLNTKELASQQRQFANHLQSAQQLLEAGNPAGAVAAGRQALVVASARKRREALDIVYEAGKSGKAVGLRACWHVQSFDGMAPCCIVHCEGQPLVAVTKTKGDQVTVELFDIWDKKKIQEVVIEPQQDRWKRIICIAASPRGDLFFAIGMDAGIVIAELQSGQIEYRIRGADLNGEPDEPPTQPRMPLSPSIAKILEKMSLGFVSSAIRYVAFSQDGNSLAFCTANGRLGIWDVRNRKLAQILETGASPHPSNSAVFTNDLRTALSYGWFEKTATVWELPHASITGTFSGKGNEGLANCAAISPSGRLSLVGCGPADQESFLFPPNLLYLLRLPSAKCVKTLKGHQHQVTSVAFLREERFAASGSHDLTIRIWDLDTGQCIRVLEGHRKSIRSLSATSDGRFLASASDEEDTVFLWELDWNYEFPR